MLRWRVEILCLVMVLPVVMGCGHSAQPHNSGRKRVRKPAALATTAARRSNAERRDTAAKSAEEEAPRVVLHTTAGDVTLRLDRQRAPRTVENFLKYVDAGYYDGTIFHQVVDGCMVLGGAFTPNLEEKPVAATIPNEAGNGLRNRRGTIAMARPLEVVDGASCQFFLNLTDNPRLDHRDDSPEGYGYCVFGEVVEGFEVLARIAKVEVATVGDFELLPVQTVMIESATRLR